MKLSLYIIRCILAAVFTGLLSGGNAHARIIDFTLQEAVNTALQELPAHQREAFVLRRFQELSYEEIAEATGAPVGTAKSRVVRAERALRPLLARFREYV